MKHIKDCKTDFTFISETWLTSLHNDVVAIVKYRMHHSIRDSACGQERGGCNHYLLRDTTLSIFMMMEWQVFFQIVEAFHSII